MMNIVLASALTAIAIGVASAAKGPEIRSNVNPAAIAQARSAIEELPLPYPAKAAFFGRIERTPEPDLPYLVEEARRAVKLPSNP